MNALACCLKRRLGVAHCLAGASALIGAAAASLFAARSGAVLATALALIEVPVMLSVSSDVRKLVRGGRVIGSLKIDQATGLSLCVWFHRFPSNKKHWHFW